MYIYTHICIHIYIYMYIYIHVEHERSLWQQKPREMPRTVIRRIKILVKQLRCCSVLQCRCNTTICRMKIRMMIMRRMKTLRMKPPKVKTNFCGWHSNKSTFCGWLLKQIHSTVGDIQAKTLDGVEGGFMGWLRSVGSLKS